MAISLDIFPTFLGQLRTESYVLRRKRKRFRYTGHIPKPGNGGVIAKKIAKPWNVTHFHKKMAISLDVFPTFLGQLRTESYVLKVYRPYTQTKQPIGFRF